MKLGDTKDWITYVHEWVTINQSFLHFNQLNIIVTKSKSIPKDVSVSCLSRLSVAILADDVLNCVNLVSTMCCVYHYVFPASIRRFYYTHDLSSSTLLLIRVEPFSFLISSQLILLLLLWIILKLVL